MKKIKYCPKCKSMNVKIDITAGAVFGAPQKWRCMNCGFESYAIFPDGEVEKRRTKK